MLWICERFAGLRRVMAPYRGIVLFVGLLFLFHYFWKLTVSNDGSETPECIVWLRDLLGMRVAECVGDRMCFLGVDVTPEWFGALERWMAECAAWFVRLFPGYGDVALDGTRLYFPENGYSVSIVWGCLGFKQLFIFTGIMCFYTGPFVRKLWYVPAGCVALTVYNVVRIGAIVILTRGSNVDFDLLHDGVFRYVYYVLLFVIWVVWAEFFDVRGEGVREGMD
jgi:exosortase/archaeosortase family protein